MQLVEIDYEGALHVYKAFNNAVNLRFLGMSCSSFSEHILLLLFGLQYHNDLKLDLKLGQLRPEGIEELITGLCLLSQNQLHYLVISKCEVTIKGAKGLTGALQNYSNLAGLKLYDNTIDPFGKAIVTHALPSLRILTELKG